MRSTGFVYVQYDKTGSGGTCWVLDRERRLAITNCHVTNNWKNGTPKFVVVFFPHYSGGTLVRSYATYLKEGRPIRAWVLAIDVQRDLSLLQLDSVPEGVEALPIARRAPRKGARIYTLGHSSMGKQVGSKWQLRKNGKLWRFARGKVLRVEFYRKGRADWPLVCKCIRVRARTNHGDSGGPVVNRRGELVGVNCLSNYKHKLSWDIHVTEVKRFLRRAPLGTARRGGDKAFVPGPGGAARGSRPNS
jgi:S1-C subfamily serine protease